MDNVSAGSDNRWPAATARAVNRPFSTGSTAKQLRLWDRWDVRAPTALGAGQSGLSCADDFGNRRVAE